MFSLGQEKTLPERKNIAFWWGETDPENISLVALGRLSSTASSTIATKPLSLATVPSLLLLAELVDAMGSHCVLTLLCFLTGRVFCF